MATKKIKIKIDKKEFEAEERTFSSGKKGFGLYGKVEIDIEFPRQIRLIFNDIRYLGYEKHYGTGFDSLWADGYYCGSAGHVSQESVKRYIQEQEGKKVFDYDIFECPEELKGQLKIGDFFG